MNGLRHSYASYRLAVTANAPEVSLEMGNTPQMIHRHYRELVTPAKAEKWFSLLPPKAIKKPKNIINLPRGKTTRSDARALQSYAAPARA